MSRAHLSRTVACLCLLLLSALLGGALPTNGDDLPPEVSPRSLPPAKVGTFKAHPYIRAAAVLQGLGRTRACRVLARLAAREAAADAGTYRAVVLCRMLFVAKPGGQFRGPAVGAPSLLGEPWFAGTQDSDWPLYPIALSDGAPFLICWGYTLGGYPESSEGYLDYCMSQCAWSDFHFSLKTAPQEEQALQDLLATARAKVQQDEAHQSPGQQPLHLQPWEIQALRSQVQ